MLITWGSEPDSRLEELARTVVETPFTRRTWAELLFMMAGMPVAFIGMAFVGITMAAGVVLAITFIGIALIGVAVRGARGIGGMQRRLAGALLDEAIDDPEPFAPRPGYLGWLQSALRDRTGWKAMAYLAVKVPLALVAFVTAFSLWWDAFRCLTYPLWGIGNRGSVAEWGAVRVLFQPGYLSPGNGGGPFVALATVITGAVFFFVAPWPVRFFDYLDRLLMRALLAPDAMTVRVRKLEQARAQTVDASAATLRRIERDLHDGTQAQLVALAMRLGMAKEKLADADHLDIDQVRDLVNDAHKGAKEAIVELRDLARGIHPPLSTWGWRGRWPPWRHGARSRPSSPSPSTSGRARPSRPSPTSAWPSSWPTSRSTPSLPGPASRAASRADGSASWFETTASEGPGQSAPAPRRVG
jgi:signal transduction histidine kinase